MKITVFDLEMSNLSANFGMLLCGGFKALGEKKVKIYRIDESPNYKEEPWDDSWLAEQLAGEIEEADILVSYNGKRFDLPFLNARLVRFDKKPIIGKKHIDLFFVSKFQLKLSNWSLDALAKHLNLPVQKTRMEGEQWTKAMTGDPEALQYIIDHCVLDVKVLEQVFKKVKGLIKMIKD
jgi:uncharacterized protein YprB with RNaseH-like and TPR domain